MVPDSGGSTASDTNNTLEASIHTCSDTFSETITDRNLHELLQDDASDSDGAGNLDDIP